jgi:hypothetical protein
VDEGPLGQPLTNAAAVRRLPEQRSRTPPA